MEIFLQICISWHPDALSSASRSQISGYGSKTAVYGGDAHYSCSVANPTGENFYLFFYASEGILGRGFRSLTQVKVFHCKVKYFKIKSSTYLIFEKLEPWNVDIFANLQIYLNMLLSIIFSKLFLCFACKRKLKMQLCLEIYQNRSSLCLFVVVIPLLATIGSNPNGFSSWVLIAYPIRCDPGHMAEDFQGRGCWEFGNLQPAVRPARKWPSQREGDLHRGVSRLHVHRSEERDMGGRELLRLFFQRVPWRVQTKADLPHGAR